MRKKADGLDKALTGHDLECPACGCHLTSLLLCAECGIRFESTTQIGLVMEYRESKKCMMKAWVVFSPDEWCTLMHADTRGKAIIKAIECVAGDPTEYIDFRVRRLPGMDDKPFTYKDCADVGFHYLDDWDGGELKEIDFVNDCPCEICSRNRLHKGME